MLPRVITTRRRGLRVLDLELLPLLTFEAVRACGAALFTFAAFIAMSESPYNRERSDRTAEPGAKRSGATGSTLNKTDRPCDVGSARVWHSPEPDAPLRFAPGSAFVDPRRCEESVLLLKLCEDLALLVLVFPFKLRNLIVVVLLQQRQQTLMQFGIGKVVTCVRECLDGVVTHGAVIVIGNVGVGGCLITLTTTEKNFLHA